MGFSRYYFSVSLLSIRMSICLSLSIWSSASIFGDCKSAARTCAQRMRLQATGSNPLIGSIICPSVCSSGCPRDFAILFFYSIALIPDMITITITITSVEVQRRDAFLLWAENCVLWSRIKCSN